MPTYKANAYLSHKNQIVQPGQLLELTEEQAKNLGDKVVDSNEEVTDDTGDVTYSETQFRDLPAEEQKEVVESLGGDLNELTNEDKRWGYVSDNQ